MPANPKLIQAKHEAIRKRVDELCKQYGRATTAYDIVGQEFFLDPNYIYEIVSGIVDKKREDRLKKKQPENDPNQLTIFNEIN